MDTLLTYSIAGVLCFFFLILYLKSLKKRDARAREAYKIVIVPTPDPA